MVIKTAYPWQHFGSIKNPPEVNGGWAVRPGEVLLLESGYFQNGNSCNYREILGTCKFFLQVGYKK
jgi:hypothetical protein